MQKPLTPKHEKIMKHIAERKKYFEVKRKSAVSKAAKKTAKAPTKAPKTTKAKKPAAQVEKKAAAVK